MPITIPQTRTGVLRPRAKVTSDKHQCEANGCNREIEEKYDFCFPCFRELPSELTDAVTRWKSRRLFSDYYQDENLYRRRHKDALDAAREFLRKRAAERIQGGVR